MIGLIRKDLYYLLHNMKTFILVSIVIGLFLTLNSYGILFILFLPACMAIGVSDCIRNDHDKNWYDLYRVLPLSLSKIIASRFLVFFAYIGLGLLLTYVYGIVAQMMLGADIFGKGFILWKGIVYACAIALLAGTSYLPLTYYHHGDKMNSSLFLSGVIGYLLYSVMSGIVSFMGLSIVNDPNGVTPFIVVCISFLYIMISWFISIYIYHKRCIAS